MNSAMFFLACTLAGSCPVKPAVTASDELIFGLRWCYVIDKDGTTKRVGAHGNASCRDEKRTQR